MTDDTGALFLKLKKQFRADREHSAKWRECAKEDFDFVAGEQWSEEDKAHLKSMMRPVITMNRTATVINAVSGQEMGNRQEVRYVPREQGDAKPNEILTEGARWFRDQAEADDEDSEAFLHNSICGMGWTDTTLDVETDDEPMPKMEAPTPLEMYWDRNARQHNLLDAQRVWRVRSMPIARVRELFPEADIADLDAAWARRDDAEGETKDQDRERLYEDDGDPVNIDEDKNVTFVHCQYMVSETAYKVAMPTGEMSELGESDYKRYVQRAKMLGISLHSTQFKRKKIKDAFIGAKVIKHGDALCQNHFRYQCITGFKDQNKGTFYGLVRQMKDPQRWANKWLSQALDIMNSQSKGGVIMEKDASDDMREFEKTWARADKPTYVPSGTLSNSNGPRIIPKPGAQFPGGFFQLMEFAITSIRDVVGVSVEMMGMADRDQPASLEYQRRQSGMMILQPLFKNLKRYRREHGKLMLYLIQNYLSDGRLVRIVGDEGAQYVPLVRQADIKYDIIVDDMPSAPNQKEMIWSMVADKLEIFSPQERQALMEYSPLPSTVIEKLKKAQQQQEQSPLAQLQQQMAALEAKLKEAEVGREQAETAKTAAEARKVASEIGADDPMMEHQIDAAKLQGEQQLKRDDMAFEHAMAVEDMNFSHAMKMRESEANIALRARQAEARPAN